MALFSKKHSVLIAMNALHYYF